VIRRLISHKHDAASANTLAAFLFGFMQLDFGRVVGLRFAQRQPTDLLTLGLKAPLL